MRQSYQVHRQRFSQKFSWLVSFWCLALSSLSKVIKHCGHSGKRKVIHLIAMLWRTAIWNRDFDKQCFCILWSVQMMSSKSKQKLKIFDTSKMNRLKHEIESENQHYAQDFKQQFHHSYHPYLEHFYQRSSCSVLIRITINEAWGNKTLQVVSIWH